MTWLDDEGSIEDSRPGEGYEFILPAVTYRVAGGSRPLTIGGNLFKANTVARNEIQIASISKTGELEVSLPVTHPIVQRYIGGAPPKMVGVNVYRQQARSGEAERIWTGLVTTLTCSGSVARLLVPARTSVLFARRLPTITAGRLCPHILYDGNCRMPRQFSPGPLSSIVTAVAATVADVSGQLVTVSTVSGAPDQAFKFGELLHVTTGERMTILSQIGLDITLQLPIPGMQLGDTVHIFVGCDHDIATCATKFANVPNFGGFPDMPHENPHIPQGFGIYQSS